MRTGLLRRCFLVCRRSRGSSIMQTTVTIGALSILAASSTPVIDKYVRHAKIIRATGEVRIIGSATVFLVEDMASRGVEESPGSGKYLELMVSAGDVPDAEEGTGSPWRWSAGQPGVGTFFDYMIVNTPGFPKRSETGAKFAWDGPYLAGEPGPDPWGSRYAYNVGVARKGRPFIPMVLCAGPDGVISIPYQITHADLALDRGDDIYQIVQ